MYIVLVHQHDSKLPNPGNLDILRQNNKTNTGKHIYSMHKLLLGTRQRLIINE